MRYRDVRLTVYVDASDRSELIAKTDAILDQFPPMVNVVRANPRPAYVQHADVLGWCIDLIITWPNQGAS